MKNLKSVFIFLVSAGLISSCDYESDIIKVINESDISITVYIPSKTDNGWSDLTDNFIGNQPETLEPGDSLYYYARIHPKQMFAEYYKAPIPVYIFAPEDIEKYGWEKVIADEMIIVQYIVSADDARHLNFRTTYPPNEEMKNVLMYPPYEEVIENYNRIISEKE